MKLPTFVYRSKLFTSGMFALIALASPGFAQQDSGDKEVGIGGQAFFTHSSNFNGQAVAQFSSGYFASKNNYFGFEADPTFTFTHTAAQGKNPASNSTDVGGFLSCSYRRFIGRERGKVFPFIGAGGGGYLTGGNSGNSAQGLLFGEIGIKDYISQKTSLEFAYRFNYLPSGSGGFSTQTLSQFVISIRHIF